MDFKKGFLIINDLNINLSYNASEGLYFPVKYISRKASLLLNTSNGSLSYKNIY